MQKKKNVTYLIGAGASAKCIPVVNGIKGGIEDFISFIKDAKASNYRQYINFFDVAKASTLINDLNWLVKELAYHKTIDTLAKKFYLIKNREEDLLKLKRLMIAYFMFEQAIHKNYINKEGKEYKELPDKRYDSFIATIISGKRDDLTLSGNFKVITWNYDMQFEIAYKEYYQEQSIKQIQDLLQSFPNEKYIKGEVKLDKTRFAILKLNGVAGVSIFDPFVSYKKPINGILNEIILSQIASDSKLFEIIEKYHSGMNDDILAFNYAWERNEDFDRLYPKKNQIIEDAISVMRETDILIIIGYSFPLFNRLIDSELIAACSAKKIYIQDPKALEIQDLLVSSFRNLYKQEDRHLDGFEYVPVEFVSSSVDQFLIPYELQL